MEGSRSLVIETISEPDFIQAGDSGELLAIRLYEATQLGRKMLWLPIEKSMLLMVLF